MNDDDRDPVGEALANELEERIRDQGMTGHVAIVTPIRAHFRHVFDAPWTAISYDKRTGEIRFRLKSRDFRTPEQAREVLVDTLHVLLQIRDRCRNIADVADRLVRSTGLKVLHDGFKDFRRKGT